MRTNEVLCAVVDDLWSIFNLKLNADSEDAAVDMFNIIFKAHGIFDKVGDDWNDEQIQPEFYDLYVMDSFESAFLHPYSISAYWNIQLPEERWKNLMYNFLNYRLS